ncbi:MAG TPA: GNAT family N-acetyltransferase, partial [candidate division WWE3 bacterium]|nr:GNAT family N-acetyltransferase [candidate division WWE3 bacterium]
FTNINLRPDELKVYPCSLIEGTDLVRLYKKGLWKPYSKKDLLSVLRFSYLNTPRYCRISRMIRDIPSTDILVGNKETNFRQTVEGSILKSSLNTPVEIRSREVKDASFKHTAIKLKKTSYKTGVSTEYFLEYILPNNKLLGFLRLSLPKGKELVPELKDASIIREVHVYGVALSLSSVNKEVQHLGLGKSLIQEAEKISRGYNYKKICVISAIGTRGYYRKQGYKDGVLYQYKKLK